VTGVLKSSGKLVDRLILSNVSSVWAIHGLHQEDAEDHDHTEAVHEHDEHEDHAEDTAHTEDEEEVVYVKSMVDMGAPEKEITAMLIQYSNPAAIGMLPRMVNQSTSMQAASPALESARLFSLLGMGIDSLQSLAYIIMFMAAFSVFISLYNAFKSRKYDLAIMRTLGASRGKLFGIVIAEGILITLFGAVLGIVFGHLTMYLIALQAGNAGSLISAFEFQQEEAWLFVVGIAVGFLAAVIPAVKAYNTSISETLADSNA
jgi:putative ABC transport system permease protein